MVSTVSLLASSPVCECVCVCGLTGKQRHIGLSRLEGAAGLTHQLLPHLLQRHHLTTRNQSHTFIHEPVRSQPYASLGNGEANWKTLKAC